MLEKKVFNVGFEAIAVVDRQRVGIDELARYPVFPEEFVTFLRRVVPAARHAELVWSITLTARKPAAQPGDAHGG